MPMNYKQQAAEYALKYVCSGMLLGLGSGSTTSYFIQALGERVRSGALHDISAVCTSIASTELAHSLGISLTSLSERTRQGVMPVLDLAVDGADEVDPELNLIKGLGRAALREKIVEMHARQFVIVVDESKIVPQLGRRGPLPVEIIPFEAELHVLWLHSLGCRAEMWLEEDGSPVVTDNGNYLVRCWFEAGIANPYALALVLAERPGIVEHGLFLDMATHIIVAGSDGIRVIERDQVPSPSR
ncbi:MAG: ribose 5-phosphate isomerase A [Chloroflexi bacterium RBG_16_52_11]|nr:MAG: ribose 5-phosphate isomerase A [Chloroflexi bacterium RBG_16_52_11]